MKKKNLFMAMLAAVGIMFVMSGCVEHNYYHQYHHHSRGYYERRHVPPPAGVEFDIHN